MMTIPYALILISAVALYFALGEIVLRFCAQLWLQWRAQRDGADRKMAAWGIERLRLRRQSEKRIIELRDLPASITDRGEEHARLVLKKLPPLSDDWSHERAAR